MVIDEIIKFNKEFVEKESYKEFIADKYPAKKLAILSCMDTRLTQLLPAALGLRNGDAKIIKNAGAVILSPFDSAMRSILVGVYELGVEEVMVIAHTTCGACHMSFGEFEHHMVERGITPRVLENLKNCGIDLDAWLEGFHDTHSSVIKTVETISKHPLLPADVVVRGFIIDSTTGELTEVVNNSAQHMD